MYKKIFLVVFLVFAAVGLAQAAAVDIATISQDLANPANPFQFRPANNVFIFYIRGSATYPNTTFTTIAKNTNGNRIFSTSNASTSIWYQENELWKGDILTSAGGLTPAPTGPLPTLGGESTYTGWGGL